MKTKEITISYEMFTGSNPEAIIYLLAVSAPDYNVVQDDNDRTFIVGRDSEMEIIAGDYIVCFASGYCESFRSEIFKAMFN